MKQSKLLSLILTICLISSMLAGLTPAHAKTVFTMNDSDAFEMPDIIGEEEAKENDYVGRVTAEENDLYTFVFANGDGTYTMRVYSHPVKYIDKNGVVRDIALDIKQKNDGGFVTANHEIITTFERKLTDGISLEYNEIGLMLVPNLGLGEEPTAELSDNGKAVTYEINDTTSIAYELTYTGFKENIIVEEYTGQTEYRFTLLTNGLNLCEEYGSYYLTDAEDIIKATIGDIIVFTADEKNNTLGTMTYETIRENQEYVLTIHLDDEYLADEKTVYPIRIDPTIEINYNNNGAGAIEDVTINQNVTFSGTSGSLHVGRHPTGSLSRTLMRFPILDLSSITAPRITSAKVEIRDLMCQSDQDITVECRVYKKTSPTWSESGTTTWSSVGTAYLGSLLDSHLISYGQGNAGSQRYSFNILAVAREWANGTQSPSKGLVFKANNTFENQTGNNIQYWHKTFASYNQSSYRRTLTIVYAAVSNSYWGTISARATYSTSSGLVYNFSPASTGTYYIETAKPIGVSSQDTVVYLLDSNYKLIAQDDNSSPSGSYSRITATLTAGKTYKVLVSTKPYNLSHNCYLVVYKAGSLCSDVSTYASFVKNFKKIGNHTDSYNCLAYALGNTSSWIWPWGEDCPDVPHLTSYMGRLGYVPVTTYQSDCVVAYGPSSSTITHFSKSVSGTVTAKCGQLELMQHSGYNAYFANGGYGTPQAYYVKVTSDYAESDNDILTILDTDSDNQVVTAFLRDLDEDIALQVANRLEDLILVHDGLINSYDLVNGNVAAFEVICDMGVELAPYILNYVIESKENGLFEAFLTSAIGELLGYNSLPGSIESDCQYACEYIDYSPKYYAYQILMDMYCNPTN